MSFGSGGFSFGGNNNNQSTFGGFGSNNNTNTGKSDLDFVQQSQS